MKEMKNKINVEEMIIQQINQNLEIKDRIESKAVGYGIILNVTSMCPNFSSASFVNAFFARSKKYELWLVHLLFSEEGQRSVMSALIVVPL